MGARVSGVCTPDSCSVKYKESIIILIMLIILLDLKQKVACLGESLYVTLAQCYLFIYFLEKK